MIDARPGTYLLVFNATEPRLLEVGRLGTIDLKNGYYCYIGSAYGPGGVRARVRHHTKISTSPHWHLDYVRPVMTLLEVWYRHDARCEHNWAQRLLEIMDVPLAGFGASDCRCDSHLFYTACKPMLAKINDEWMHSRQFAELGVCYNEVL